MNQPVAHAHSSARGVPFCRSCKKDKTPVAVTVIFQQGKAKETHRNNYCYAHLVRNRLKIRQHDRRSK